MTPPKDRHRFQAWSDVVVKPALTPEEQGELALNTLFRRLPELDVPK